MIKLLTFSTLYPSSIRPNHGIFVETRLRHLLKSGHVESHVVAPVPWFPFKGEYFNDYAKFAQMPYEEIHNGIHILHPRFPLIPKIGMSLAPIFMALSMMSVIRHMIRNGFDFDIIDAHYFYPDGVAAVILGEIFNKPVTVTARGTDINLIPNYSLPRKMILWAAQRASGVISVCQFLKDAMVKLGIDVDHIVSLRNGVDLDMFRPIDRVKCRGELDLKYFTLLSVGRLVETKGHALIMQALTAMPDVELLIIGEGPDRYKLECLAKMLRIENRVTLLGSIPQADLRRYYGSVDALVLASVSEGWANVLLESMACGTPVIASKVGGTPEILGIREVGLFLHERSAKGIVQAVNELRAHYPDRDVTRHYAEQFSWEATTQGQLDLFQRILVRKSS